MKRGLDMHNFSVIKATLEREEVAFQGSCLFISDWNTTFSAKWNRLISLRIHLYSHRMQSGLLNFQEMECTTTHKPGRLFSIRLSDNNNDNRS